MVEIEVERGPAGAITAFAVHGHAGMGARGRDIVCAGVSALADTAVLGLERRLGVAAEVRAGPGELRCRLPRDLPAPAAARAADLLESICLGLEAIARAYPGRVRFRSARAGGAGRGPSAGPVMEG